MGGRAGCGRLLGGHFIVTFVVVVVTRRDAAASAPAAAAARVPYLPSALLSAARDCSGRIGP